MKAISLWQPWATMLACGFKTHETRSWPTKHRGEIAIHAARHIIGQRDRARLLDTIREIVGHGFGVFPHGAIIAVVSIEDCRWTEDSLPKNDADRALGDWSPGRYAWRVNLIDKLEHPVSCRGFQGIWRLTPDQERAVRQQMQTRAAA